VVRDASGRIVQTIERQNERAVTRDASGRIVGTSPGSGKCQKPGLVPLPPSSTKK
jgi:YD repeat-containing protein